MGMLGNVIWRAMPDTFESDPGVATFDALNQERALLLGKTFPFPRLIIADPSLVDGTGHHYELTRTIASGAKALGIPCICAVHKSYKSRAKIEGARIKPVFKLDMYDFYKGKEKKVFDPINDGEAAFIKPIERLIKSENLGSSDHILFHTCDAFFFEAFACIEASRMDGWPVLHLCTPYDDHTMPNRHFIKNLRDTLWALGGLATRSRNVYFYGETRRLASYLRRNTGLPCFGLELPTPIAIKDLADVSSRGRKKIKIVYMGAARTEKGFALLPDIISSLTKQLRPSLLKNIEFIIQASPQKIGYLPEIKEAIGRLETFPKSLVKLKRKHRPAEEYYNTIADADIVLLLYDKDQYRVRGSAVAVEAVSLGKIVLATHNTFPASLVVADRGGRVGKTTQDHANNLVNILNSLEINRLSAELNGQTFRTRCAAATYVAKLISRKTLSDKFVSETDSFLSHLSAVSQEWPVLVDDGEF